MAPQTAQEDEKKEQKEKTQSTRKHGLSKVNKIIAVSSCKGGVGKSTVALNLALTLKKQGKKVGILDADIYGPSLPTMLAKENQQIYSNKESKQLIPLEFEGIKAISYGFISQNRAVLRGAMVAQLVAQLAFQSAWGELDYLIIDMPPGTGDVQITICQEIVLDGAVIVTTPQRLSFVDVVKGIEMFDVLKVPAVSIVENMSSFNCEKCDHPHHIFGEGYLNQIKNQFGIQNTVSLPLQSTLAYLTDVGKPQVLSLPEEHTINQIYYKLANQVENELINLEGKVPPVVSYDEYSNKLQLHIKGNLTHNLYEITPRKLRIACSCAVCKDEFTGKQLLKEEKISENVKPTGIQSKGNYAVAIQWSDGHKSSIYPYTLIQKHADLVE